MDNGIIKITVNYGYSEIKQFNKFENERMTVYSYRIDYDSNWVETKRTEPEALSSIGWDDGSRFTKKDYEKLSLWTF